MDEQRVREIVREEIEKVSDAYFSRSIDTPTRSAFLKLIRHLEEALVSRPVREGVPVLSAQAIDIIWETAKELCDLGHDFPDVLARVRDAYLDLHGPGTLEG